MAASFLYKSIRYNPHIPIHNHGTQCKKTFECIVLKNTPYFFGRRKRVINEHYNITKQKNGNSDCMGFHVNGIWITNDHS